MLILFFVLESLALQDLVGIIVGIVSLFLLARSNLVRDYISSSSSLVTTLTRERDAALASVEELDKENKMMRRELSQRSEIWLLDQQEIRRLKGLNG